jgi:hypothetical protein
MKPFVTPCINPSMRLGILKMHSARINPMPIPLMVRFFFVLPIKYTINPTSIQSVSMFLPPNGTLYSTLKPMLTT